MYTIHHGDCLEVMQNFEEESIDVVVTSPPYNVGIKYSKHEDNMSRDDYLNWLHAIFSEIKRVLKPEGHLFLNMGYTNVDPWVGMDVAQKLRDLFTLQNNITWVKSITLPDNKTTGHFKPINSKRFINPTNEHIFHFTKKGKSPLDRLAIGVPYADKSNLKERKKKKNKTGKKKADKRCRGNTWFIPYETIKNKKSKGYHPAIFPKLLVEYCVRLSGVKKGVVLDPFSGTGTTVVKVKELNENEEEDFNLEGIGIDIDEKYVKYSKELLEIDEITIEFED